MFDKKYFAIQFILGCLIGFGITLIRISRIGR